MPHLSISSCHSIVYQGNVLLNSDLHCQITDFGLTRHFESTVAKTTTTLLLSYAAPELFGMCILCTKWGCKGCYEGNDEQHQGKTMETDVYAFGCLYYAVSFKFFQSIQDVEHNFTDIL